MKRRMKVLMLAVLAAIILLTVGALLFKRFVTDHTLDKDGMENPNYTGESEDPQMLDGDYTYVDNEALLNVITGTWASADGRYEMTLRDDCGITLTLDGETVLDDHIQFTYLQPGYVQSTEFNLDSRDLKHSDGTVFAEVGRLYHENSSDHGRIILELACEDGGSETVEFRKTA